MTTTGSGLTHLFHRRTWPQLWLLTVDCISRFSGPVRLILRYTTPDIHCRYRRYEWESGINVNDLCRRWLSVTGLVAEVDVIVKSTWLTVGRLSFCAVPYIVTLSTRLLSTFRRRLKTILRSISAHVTELLANCARTLFALRTFKQHGLPSEAVFQATLMAKINYTPHQPGGD